MPEPQTLVVPGSGGSVLAYALPANVLQYVESVVAVIDNSGGADAKPVLSIATGGGTPIADKTQGEAIPGGDTGRATWAHRLTDEHPATPAGGGSYIFVAQQNTLASGNPITFAVPNDGRHLALDVFGSGALQLTFNGDGGSHYQTIATRMRSFNGVITTDATTSGVTSAIVMPGFGVTNRWRALIDIPYYRFSPSFGKADRSLEARVWEHDDDTLGSGNDDLWKVEFAGFWKYGTWPALPVPAITSVKLDGFGAGMVASLYKVM